MGAAEVDGLQSQGVIATLKHFPGLGSMNCNPHFCLPVINSSRATIEQTDLAPYRALMSHHPGMVMTTDLLMPALDPKLPAELSKPIVTGILRDEIGYDGVVVTDALYMQGITDRFSFTQAAIMAFEAGNDMIMAPWRPNMIQAIITGMKAELQKGKITQQQIDASVTRILALKIRYNLITGATGGSTPTTTPSTTKTPATTPTTSSAVWCG
jgi:beta-N-acetylhexosaminidase